MLPKILSLVVFCILMVAACGFATAGPVIYTVTDLGTLGGNYSNARGINDLGQVVGCSYTSAGSQRAYLWRSGSMTNLGTLGGNFSYAWNINNSGQVIGYSGVGQGGLGFLWQNGIMLGLGTLPNGHYSEAFGINNLGQIAGYSYGQDNVQRACTWRPGVGTTDLSAALPNPSSIAWTINDSGQVAGSGGGVGGVCWDPSYEYTSYWTGVGTSAYGINNLGQVVGIATAGNAFLWDAAGGIRNLGRLPGSNNSAARDINDQGEVVGFCTGGNPVAFVWKSGQGMFALNDLIGTSANEWSLQVAWGINNSGQIIGDGYRNGTPRAFLLTPEVVPEPSGLLALGSGLLGLGGFILRRRR